MSQRQMLESGGLKSKLWVAFCPVWSCSWAATPPYTLPTIGHSCPVTYVLISILSTSRVLLLDRPEKLIQMIIQIFQGGQLANLSQAQLTQNHVANNMCDAVCIVCAVCSVPGSCCFLHCAFSKLDEWVLCRVAVVSCNVWAVPGAPLTILGSCPHHHCILQNIPAIGQFFNQS